MKVFGKGGRRWVRTLASVAVAVGSALAVPVVARAQSGPPPEVRAAVDAVVAMLQSSGEGPLRAFAEARLDPAYRRTMSDDAWVAHLAGLREAVASNTGGVGVEADDQGLLVVLSGAEDAPIRVALAPGTARIVRIERAEAPGEVGADRRATVEARMLAIEGLGQQGGRSRFMEHVVPELQAALRTDSLGGLLDEISVAAAAAMNIMSDARPDHFVLSLRGNPDLDVHFQVEDGPPYRITTLWATRDVAPMPGSDAPPLSWSELGSRIEALLGDGFSGTVLALRGPDTLLYRGFGLANRSAGKPADRQTIYDIGSAPLDFTRAAVLLAVQRGQLALDDPITRVFPDVPADKRSMTFRHLMEGRSGLPQFHHAPGDADRDLTWMDRETAEGRILGLELLHAPGEGQSPSHSAFVLLSAALERVTGMAYPDFLRTNFLTPLGMTSTGFYGERAGHPDEDFAIGYGVSSVGPLNIPPYWGPTSWLIMGSGGMFSTVGDMDRFFRGLRAGRVLHGAALASYLARRSVLGGSERGFRYVQAWDGGDDTIFMMSNSNDASPAVGALPLLLVDLVSGGAGGS